MWVSLLFPLNLQIYPSLKLTANKAVLTSPLDAGGVVDQVATPSILLGDGLKGMGVGFERPKVAFGSYPEYLPKH